MIETDLFEFAYVPDWYGQLRTIGRNGVVGSMAIPKAPDRM